MEYKSRFLKVKDVFILTKTFSQSFNGKYCGEKAPAEETSTFMVSPLDVGKQGLKSW